MALTDIKIKQAKAREKIFRISDEKGLYIEIHPSGAKYWRHKYRFAGKEKRIGHGVYPEVTLAEARIARDEARRLLREGIDPSQLRKTTKAKAKFEANNTFSALAAEWYEKQRPSWALSTAVKREALIRNDLNPWLGNTPVNQIDTHSLLSTLQRIEDRGAIDTAHNARQVLNQIFRYAKQTQRVTENPAVDLQGALRPKTTRHRPAITDPTELGKLLTAIDKYDGTHIVRCLLKLCPLLFQRPGEMIAMRWDEIDQDAAIWNIPASKMKMGIAHTVPLSHQALAVLEDIKPLTSHRAYVFPGARNPRSHVSAATINNSLQKLGYDTKTQHCAHGFRATARTLLDEVMEYRLEWIEQQLAHQVRDSLGRAYNRTKHLPQRAEMMQAWADYLDKLKASHNSHDNIKIYKSF
ncbi:tyrosine-type recombinase/integrase [Spongiibacter marinus]|uniref:tyrosine-type recombinase/integrase n=1 Tax=Spongiibacter marinus TaxID=354246 RepID=UPI001961C344|nr:integrase arm-type DNA-binding domain-containing protein [Spongiibacter marinus]MBM7424828.1 integrase [Spongiibacter marinus]